MKTTTNVPTGWQPDPSGGHELRLFSPQGDPTAHVSNAGFNSYEEMPGAVIIDPPRSGDDASADTNGRARRPRQLTGAGPDVRVNQMASLVARMTLLTSVDPRRRAWRVVPAFSLILLAFLLERN